MAEKPSVGEKALDFFLKDERGETFRLSSLAGKQNVLLIFYPGDDTPGCTKQLCAIRDDQEKFNRLNCVVYGVNHADAESHEKFIKKHKLTSHLLIDEDKKISTRYGAIKTFFGNPVIKRTVVLVDRQGIIRYLKRGLPPNEEMLSILH